MSSSIGVFYTIKGSLNQLKQNVNVRALLDAKTRCRETITHKFDMIRSIWVKWQIPLIINANLPFKKLRKAVSNKNKLLKRSLITLSSRPKELYYLTFCRLFYRSWWVENNISVRKIRPDTKSYWKLQIRSYQGKPKRWTTRKDTRKSYRHCHQTEICR